MPTMEYILYIIVAIILFLICALCRSGKRKPMFSAPVVVTTTTIPVAPPTGYPAQNTPMAGYPMPQPQPGYPPQPGLGYPNQPMPYPPMPQPQVDYNPPSYDQVIRGGEAYQKQAPYNPNFTGPQ